MLWEDIGGRTYMEDTMSFDTQLPHGFSYYGVFDGHGGPEVSAYLKVHLRDVIKHHILTSFSDRAFGDVNIPQMLFEAIKQIVNDIPYKLAMDTGSTAVIILKRNNTLWVANIGDSRAIMNKGHKSIPLTKDHKPDDPEENKRIVELGGKVIKAYPGDVFRVNGVLALSRAIGDFSLAPHVTWKPDITVYHTNTSLNHYVMVATDGIWDVLSNNEVVDIINQKAMHNKWQDIGHTLITLARSRNSSDNISCMLIIL
jgi:serine/threonine protein phosphatase PrpC